MPAADRSIGRNGISRPPRSIRGFIKGSRNCLRTILRRITLGGGGKHEREREPFRFSAESEKYYTVARLTDVPSSLSRYQLRGLSK